MVLGTKDFPVSGPHPDKFYHNWSEIDKTYHDGLIQHVEKAPSVSSSVKTILDAATATNVPKAVYAGAGAGLFKWVVPYLPTSAVDHLFGSFFRVDLIQRPRSLE